jgi:sugar transferase EpsL
MTNEKDVNGNLLANELRLTPFGKFLRSASLDELPELVNIIKGEMSLVGPRPLKMEYLNLYNEQQARRHEIRPVITGWAQINGRNAVSFEERFKMDVWYVEHHSIWLDLKIIFLTVLKVLKKEGNDQMKLAEKDPFKGTK